MEENFEIPRVKMPTSMLDFVGILNLMKLAKHLLLEHFIKTNNLDHGADKKMLQIGGTGRNPDNTIRKTKNKTEPFFYDMDYTNMDLEDDGNPKTIIADITNCPEVESEQFDFILCTDTFEHIAEPWKAAKEIVRLLKPNGVYFMFAPFAWRYHEAPIDYWRFSPQCLAYLFKDLELIEANWTNDLNTRRGGAERGIQGNGSCNDLVPEDRDGGWRENWRVYYCGRKK